MERSLNQVPTYRSLLNFEFAIRVSVHVAIPAACRFPALNVKVKTKNLETEAYLKRVETLVFLSA